MNALKNIGTKVVTTMIAAGLVAGAAFAASGSTVSIKLEQPINVCGTILPGGQYTITESTVSGGLSVFVFRGEKGDVASAVGMRVAEPATDQKTEVVLSHEGATLHLDKMFIEGDSAGYQFADSK